MENSNIQPSKQLHLKVRAGFITQGRTLAAWCHENGINPTNARHALIGSWDGPKGRALRVELLNASGVTGPSSAAA